MYNSLSLDVVIPLTVKGTVMYAELI